MTIKSHLTQDEDATAVEFAVMIGLVAIAIVGAVTALGLSVRNVFGIPQPDALSP